jgi:hypothetical protein
MKKLVSIVLLGLAVGTIGVFAKDKKDTTDYKKLWETEKANNDALCEEAYGKVSQQTYDTLCD